MPSPWHESPKSAYWGGEFGTKAQYLSPQSSPAAGLKQQTLSIKNTQQDLTGEIIESRLQGYASIQGKGLAGVT